MADEIFYLQDDVINCRVTYSVKARKALRKCCNLKHQINLISQVSKLPTKILPEHTLRPLPELPNLGDDRILKETQQKLLEMKQTRKELMCMIENEENILFEKELKFFDDEMNK